MALQDVNSGNFGTSNKYIIYWTEMTEEWTDTAGNLSNITVRVWAKRTNTGYTTYGTGTLYCTIAGTQYTAGISSSQKITSTPICLFEKNLNIGHNDDGTGRVDIYAQISMDVVSSGSNGWGFGLTTIPRASNPSLSATTFDMGGSVNIFTNRASSSFTHTIKYSFGSDSATIATGVTDSCTWNVPISLANQVPNAASGWGTIICETYNGSTLVGTKSVTFTANVPASVVPIVEELNVSIDGTGKDSVIGKFIQSISKVTTSFSSDAYYGATVSSNVINVKRQSDGGDSQNISGGSGVTANPVTLSGIYLITATATDSRGRTASITKTITVEPYSKPTINAFTVGRRTDDSSHIDVVINALWSLAADNPTDITVDSVDNVGTNTNLYTLNDSTAGSLNATNTYVGQSDASSYIYTLTVTDSFGNTAKAEVTIGTSFVELSIAKGQGVGIGKVWERGALDVGGDIFMNGAKVIPSGSIQMFAGSESPAGYLICQGQEVSRTDYADLFAVIGTTYGSGDNSTTFNIPDMRNQVAVGFNPGQPEFDTLGKKGGEMKHTLTVDEMPSHNHTAPTWDGTTNGSYEVASTQYGYDYPNGAPTSNTGGNQPHNNLQPYITLNFIIKI